MWDTDIYGECPAADIAEVCERIKLFLKRRRGIQLSLSPQKLHRSILEYIWMRYSFLPTQISYPKRKQEAPIGWNVEKERIWRQWIFHECDGLAWEREVMNPIFGTDERLWEAQMSVCSTCEPHWTKCAPASQLPLCANVYCDIESRLRAYCW